MDGLLGEQVDRGVEGSHSSGLWFWLHCWCLLGVCFIQRLSVDLDGVGTQLLVLGARCQRATSGRGLKVLESGGGGDGAHVGKME